MMLHRHFEKEREQNLTTTKDFVKEEEKPVEEAPKRRGRPPKKS